MTKFADSSNLANFWANRGRHVVKRFGVYWYQVQANFLQSLPYQRTVDPSPDALDQFLRSEHATGARFPSDNWPSLPGGCYVISQDSYDISSVHPKTRARVRRGLENFDIGPIEPAMLLDQGLRLARDTMKRQGRYDSEFGDPVRWRNLVKAVEISPGITIYGAQAKGRLAAFIITCRDEGWLQILHQMSGLAELPLHANHALTYAVTRMACESPDIKAVNYGLVGMQTIRGLHEYKLRMGYHVEEHNNVIRLHPRLAPFLGNRVVALALRLATKLRPRDQFLERTEHTIETAFASRPSAAA